ncbi:MAG: hypothetical protein QNJ44_04485 [Rhodobacter sp.]|nr:hypothetical protein [Rhodobacter sp.]
MVTVTLTSIPPRFATLGPQIETLLAQHPDRLCLTIPHSYRRFRDWDGTLPKLPAGAVVLRTRDYGPATKFAAVFDHHPKADILIADDDCDYGPGWLASFRTARDRHPNAVIAASSFDTGRLGLPPGHRVVQGFAGLLLCPADIGPPDLSADDPAIWVDDIWLSARIAAAGLPVIACPEARAAVAPSTSPAALQDAVIDGETRATLNRLVARDLQSRFRVWQIPG